MYLSVRTNPSSTEAAIHRCPLLVATTLVHLLPTRLRLPPPSRLAFQWTHSPQLTRFWAVPRRRLGTTIQITRTQLEAHPYLIPPVIPGQVRSPPLLILQVDGVTHTQLPLGKWIAPTSRIPCFVALQETACKRSPRQNPGMDKPASVPIMTQAIFGAGQP